MKTINAKRIAAVAASLLMGLAFASTGGVTWSNIPIINNQGQPVVQVVVGSGAKPSDGVVAANIAAVLGNLAFTSQNVTATPTGLSKVNCVVTTPTCTLSNQQVWFGVQGYTGPSGSYSFTALIGSVLNQGVQLSSPANTKSLQTSIYTFPESSNLQISPVASPFSAQGSVPTNATAYGGNSGGLTFSSFTSSGQDNILQIGPSQLPALANNWGSYSENEYLWLTGFPVYDQATGSSVAPGFAVLSAGGAYQVVFNKPIPEPYVQSGNTINNAAMQLLGKNWTVLGYSEPSATATTTSVQYGGMLTLAASLGSMQTVYVGHNVSSGPFTVQLEDLGQPNSSGTSTAAVDVFFNGTLTNTTQLTPKTTTKFTVNKQSIYVDVNQTFAGLYAYQKWAKMKLYSNLFNVTSGQPLNKTNAKGWTAYLAWTNGTSSGHANELQSIDVVNQTPVNLRPGGSYSFVTPNMTAYKVNFVGDTLGTNYDPVQFSLSSISSGGVGAYQNLGTGFSSTGTVGYSVTNITNQPAQLLTVTSQIPNAFTYSGQTGSSVVYDLTPYALNIDANAVTPGGAGATTTPINVIVYSTLGNANVINPNNPLTVTIKGFQTKTSGSATTYPVQVALLPGATNTIPVSVNFYNITNIYMSRALPYMTVNVVGGAVSTSTANTLAQLVSEPEPAFMYSLSNQNYDQMALVGGSNTLTYNQQNGQPSYQGGFAITAAAPTPSQGSSKYFTYSISEYNVPSSTASSDSLAFGIYNSTTAGAQNFQLQLNQSSTGTRNNVTYTSSQSNAVQVQSGFVTERGSKVASISQSGLTLDMAKNIDQLQFVVSQYKTSLGNTTTQKLVGPVGIGQSVPGYANLTVSKVNATCGGLSASSSSCTVTGLGNVTATPSVTQAVVPVSLNTATNPLVVLDSNANSAATLVVVGSKYVNSVAAQIFSQQPALNSSFGQTSVVVQAYGTNRILVAGYSANQTVQAGNQFINDLLSAASTP